MSAPGFVEYGGAGPTLHFAHANGFPCGAYRKLLRALAADHRVLAMPLRPLWRGAAPDSLRVWEDAAHDLRTALRGAGVVGGVGVGHSLGAVVTLMAAAHDPELFRGLVLLDPVLFTGPRALLWGLVKRVRLQNHMPIVKSALRRRDHWPSREAVRASYATKPVFARFDPECLDDYLEAGLLDTPEGVILRYTKAWEARIFSTTPSVEIWSHVRRLRLPVLVLRGDGSDAFLPEAAARVARDVPGAEIVTLADASHLFPLERPLEVAEHVRRFVATTLSRRR